MTNDHSDPPKADVQAAQGPRESPSRLYKENLNQPQLSNPPETPTPPQAGGTNSTRAPEPMTLPERHQSALRHIHTLESHNAKLYEDNCQLVNTVNMLNARLAFFGAPQNLQVLRLSDMQEKLRTSEENRALINRKHQELLHCISAGTGSAHHHIYVELQAVRDAYASLDREYRLLRDKYVRLKAVGADTTRVAQQQSQARGLIPIVRPELRAHDQTLDNSASSTSVLSPGFFQPFLDQKGNNQRRSSESVMPHPSLRSGPTSVPTTWLAPLPTPPPSAPLPGGQISPTGFPVHATVPTGSLAFPHHAPMTHGPRALSGLPSITQSRHLVEQDASEQLKAAVHLRQRCEEITDTNDNEPVPCGKQISTPTPLESNPRPSKRPNPELQTSKSPGGERKKPRTEGENVHSTTINADTYPANKTLSPLASTNPHNDHKLSESGSNIRSYQDCVNLIFEKDADVENGVFCGLCFDRHQAKMIPEPPDVLVQPDLDFLVKHCMTTHPTVWDDLRRKT